MGQSKSLSEQDTATGDIATGDPPSDLPSSGLSDPPSFQWGSYS